MKVLGLDTATLTAGIAIVDDDRVLVDTRHTGTHRTNDLLVSIDRACREADIAPRELDAVAIGAGPGSFTGLRIGMATAKGIAFAARRPLWAVSSLAALAHAAGPTAADVVVAALDARRAELFAGCYRADGTLLGGERTIAPADLAAWARELAGPAASLAYAGDALDVYPDLLHALRDVWLAARTPSGAAVARLALAGPRTDILVGGTPTYIRPSEAEVKYPDGVPGALRKRP